MIAPQLQSQKTDLPVTRVIDMGDPAAAQLETEKQSAAQEAIRMALEPLYLTGYALTDFLTVKDAFGAEQIVISSASSKTGYALAQLLRQSELTQRVIGLTSPRNADFVRKTGCYDNVVLYEDIE